MAAGGYKEFVAGETLDQDEINDYLMQGVLVFAGTAARGSAIGTPVEGQFSFLKDSDSLEYYDGSAWAALSTETPPATISGTTGSPTEVTEGSDTIYIFKGDGSFTVSEAGVLDILVVGGGGCGGPLPSLTRHTGGGGAGGVGNWQKAYMPVGTATVTVGAGAAAPSGGGFTRGNNGEVSNIFFSDEVSWTAPGGGAGGGGNNNGQFGASAGSGGDEVDWPSVDGFIGLGNASGSSAGVSGSSSGGAGGASATGANASGSTGGAGGVGEISTILNASNATAQSVGEVSGSDVYYGGGGGGGASSTGGAGGLGGGGTGASNTTSNPGSANTGGGGGGKYGVNSAGSAGGSGLVIVRVVNS